MLPSQRTGSECPRARILLLLVEQDELELGPLLGQAAPVRVDHVAVLVVLRGGNRSFSTHARSREVGPLDGGHGFSSRPGS